MFRNQYQLERTNKVTNSYSSLKAQLICYLLMGRPSQLSAETCHSPDPPFGNAGVPVCLQETRCFLSVGQISDESRCPQCSAWSDPEWVLSHTDPRIPQTGPEGWSWVNNMLQAQGSQGLWVLVSRLISTMDWGPIGGTASWDPGTDNNMEGLGTLFQRRGMALTGDPPQSENKNTKMARRRGVSPHPPSWLVTTSLGDVCLSVLSLTRF